MVTITADIREMARAAKQAAGTLAKASVEQRNEALHQIREAVESNHALILEANQADLQAGEESGLDDALLDRLALDEPRLKALEAGLNQVAELPDPIGDIQGLTKMPSGIEVGTMRVPLGVIGIIYESRPNVTVEAAASTVTLGRDS